MDIGKAFGLASELFEQDSVLFLEVLDNGLLLPIDPAGNHEKEELQLCVHGRHKTVQAAGSQASTPLRPNYLALQAFNNCSSLTSVTISNSVTSIGNGAFSGCASLTAITVAALNSVYSSVAGVLFNKSQTTLIEYRGGQAGSYTIPNGVTSIGAGAFTYCTRLTSVTIPNSVTNIADYGFNECTSLTGVYFQGNAPSLSSSVFDGDNNATVYYLPGTTLPGATGWPSTFGGRPTVLWNPQVQTGGASFGVRTNRFGFTITGTSGIVIVVEACTNLANHTWSPVGTNTLTGGSSYFSDPRWTNYTRRLYRLRSP